MVRVPKLRDGARVGITDTTLRDAHQSLMATRMRTDHMLQVAAYLDRVGFYSMEVWGGATFDACLRYMNEDPWERLKLLRETIVKTPLQMLLRGQSLVGYRPYADDVVDRFVEKSVDNGIDIVRIFDALNDIRNVEHAAAAVKRAGGHFQGAISYTVSPVHTVEGYVKYAKELKNVGADSICVKDMGGIIMPYAAEALVRELVDKVGLPVQLHSHYTSGAATMSCLKAVEAGAMAVDCAVSSMALGASQPPAESIIVSLEGTKYDTMLNVRQIKPAAVILKEIIKQYDDGMAPRFVDTDVLDYQVPGGMISNLRSQLRQNGMENRLGEILAEIPRVRADLGYPPLVTPMSQMVGAQSTQNVISGERYRQIPKEVRSYMRGEYGRPAGEMNPEVRAKAIGDEQVVTGRPGDRVPPGMDAARQAVVPYCGTEEDALSYAIFPEQALKYFEFRAARG